MRPPWSVLLRPPRPLTRLRIAAPLLLLLLLAVTPQPAASVSAGCNWVAEASGCSKTCGGGTQTVSYRCSCGPAALCPAAYKPSSIQQTCNAQPCRRCPTLLLSSSAINCSFCHEYDAVDATSFRSDARGLVLAYDTVLHGWALRRTSSPPVLEAFLPAATSTLGPAAPASGVVWLLPDSRGGDGSVGSFRAAPSLSARCLKCHVGTDTDGRSYYTSSTSTTCKQVQPTCGSPQTQVEAPTPTSDRVCSAPCTVSKCATCLPTSEQVCEHCTAGFYLLNGACVASCPPAAPVADPRTRRCRPCASGHVMLQAATSFAPPVCGSCANSSCYSCDSEDRIACTGCQLDETLHEFRCLASTQTVILVLGVEPPAFNKMALERIASQMLGVDLRVTATDIVPLGGIDHITTAVVACDLWRSVCLSASLLQQRLNDNLVKTPIMSNLGYSYNTKFEIARETSKEEESNALVPRYGLIIIGVGCGALLLIFLLLARSTGKSKYRAERRRHHGQNNSRLALLPRRPSRHGNDDLEFEDNPFNEYYDDSDPFLRRYSTLVRWFRDEELVRGVGLSHSKQLYLWFCGLISTRRTEVILNCAPHGSFLVRLHRRRPGYILSLKCHNEVLHYRIRVSSEHFYYIVASNGSGLHHPSLRELVRYHLREPVPEGCRLRRVAGDGGRSYARLINAISRLEDESARSSGYSRRHSSSGGVIDRVYEQPRSGAALRVGDDADSGSDGEDPIYVPLPPPEAQTAAQVIYAPLPEPGGHQAPTDGSRAEHICDATAEPLSLAAFARGSSGVDLAPGQSLTPPPPPPPCSTNNTLHVANSDAARHQSRPFSADILNNTTTAEPDTGFASLSSGTAASGTNGSGSGSVGAARAAAALVRARSLPDLDEGRRSRRRRAAAERRRQRHRSHCPDEGSTPTRETASLRMSTGDRSRWPRASRQMLLAELAATSAGDAPAGSAAGASGGGSDVATNANKTQYAMLPREAATSLLRARTGVSSMPAHQTPDELLPRYAPQRRSLQETSGGCGVSQQPIQQDRVQRRRPMSLHQPPSYQAVIHQRATRSSANSPATPALPSPFLPPPLPSPRETLVVLRPNRPPPAYRDVVSRSTPPLPPPYVYSPPPAPTQHSLGNAPGVAGHGSTRDEPWDAPPSLLPPPPPYRMSRGDTRNSLQRHYFDDGVHIEVGSR